MAKKSFDYSKWDNIELSDDESDLHPNIDKDSWFRMKHRSRLEREAREDEEIAEMNKQNEKDNSRIKIIKARMDNLSKGQADDDAEFEDTEALQGELNELQNRVNEKNAKIEAIREKRAWNIDNICHVAEERSIVNDVKVSSLKADDFKPTGLTEQVMKANREAAGPSAASSSTTATADSPPPAPKSASTSSSAPSVAKPVKAAAAPAMTGPAPVDSVQMQRLAAMSYNDYVLGQEQILEHYSEIADLDDTKQYLFRNGHILLHEHAQSYMLLSCLEDEMNGKHRRMKLVCRQSQILSHITELAVSMRRDPRDVIIPFFLRIQEDEHKKAFEGAVKDFIDRIKKRAVEKRKEMDAERRREEMEEVPLGPGGLNPFEVLEQLPKSMRDAFDSQDIGALHKAVAEMDAQDAKKWMKMCVDSGLWCPQDKDEFNRPDEEEEEEPPQVEEVN